MPNTDLPLVALLSLANNVKLGMLPASHKLVSTEGPNSLCQAIEYQFKVGEILIFHPLFVHYGCAYQAFESSLRVHFYFDNDQLKRADGNGHRRTFFFALRVRGTWLRRGARRVNKRKQNMFGRDRVTA